MKLSAHIETLLREDHDCVIVPGLGGFVVNPKDAKIKLPQHRFSPPGKEIGFNSKLNKNDGLLTNAMAERHGITYDQALEDIKRIVKDWHAALNDGKEVELGVLGKLHRSKQGKTFFTRNEQFTFDQAGFGLAGFSAVPIEAETITRSVERKLKTKTPAGKTHWSQDWKMAAAIPLFIAIGAFGAWTLNSFGVLDHQADQAGMEPSTDAIETPIDNTGNESAAIETPIQMEEEFPEHDPIALQDVLEPIDEELDVADQVEEEVIEETPEPAATVAANNRFHVIGGCFSVLDNAERMVQTLKEDGYDAAIVGQNGKGLHRVSIQGYTSRREAKAGLEQIRATSRSGWVLAL